MADKKQSDFDFKVVERTTPLSSFEEAYLKSDEYNNGESPLTFVTNWYNKMNGNGPIEEIQVNQVNKGRRK